MCPGSGERSRGPGEGPAARNDLAAGAAVVWGNMHWTLMRWTAEGPGRAFQQGGRRLSGPWREGRGDTHVTLRTDGDWITPWGSGDREVLADLGARKAVCDGGHGGGEGRSVQIGLH